MANVSATQIDHSHPATPAGLKRGPSIDFATLLGVCGGFAMIIGAMIIGGRASSFLDIPSVLIVIGGTFLVTTISFSINDVVRAQGVMMRALVYHVETPSAAALQVLYLADVARQKGALALQSIVEELQRSRFLYNAIMMVVDGMPPEEIERILTSNAEATRQRHSRAAGVLRRAGEVAPAMGLIGTLVGLVQMLGNLEDPSTIGPAMAVALLTTFYGAILANMVFIPLANKLERNSDIEAMVNQIYLLGSTSISRQENPRRLEMMINTILPPAQRVAYYD